MRIMNNVGSLNAWRNLTSTDQNLSKSLERLSSGFRINRAADDAAGLAISEKMRAQINGMNQAARNAQDGISLVQTAEGALNEVHTILQRMRELSVQAANGTLTGADRNTIQTEMDQLSSEITRIGNTTQFNSKDLINGAVQAAATGVGGGTGQITFQIGANQGQTMTFDIAALDAFSLGVSRDVRETQDNNNLLNTVNVGAYIDRGTGTDTALADGTYSVQVNWDGTAYTADILDSTGTTILAAPVVITAGSTVSFTSLATTEIDINFDNALQGQAGVAASWTAEIQVARAQSTQFATGSKTADATTIAGLDLTTEQNASNAITAINTAINTVSAQRANLGAMQNRLEHTINNLQVVSENLVASESRVRDLDMAMEMAKFTKSQIMMEAGTAMLAQANAKSQSVLSLLR